MSSMEDSRAEVARLREQVAELSRARDEAIRGRDDLLSAIRQMPSAIALVRGPEHVFELVNDAWRGFALETAGGVCEDARGGASWRPGTAALEEWTI
ncbi:hypothetical protein [Sorangium sp. So ce1389]|uniref:hypothetical protein n=1 Tax=Sorangium sp. So ce1389 TaxID=3133336 RepID=UPI003F644A2A